MSRSIHATVHQWSEVERWEFADDEEKGRIRATLLDKLIKKGRLTRQVSSQRRDGVGEQGPAAIETIPIGVEDAGPFVHYPAGPDDLRGIMHRLPRGVLDGLDRIDLQLGSYDQANHRGCRCVLSPDPYVGRLGGNYAPGVYQGHVLGTYQRKPARIFVFGYVYDQAVANRELVELGVRRQMLDAFVHEVAHHDDHMRRTGRGRWLGNDSTKSEAYAEKGAIAWSGSCVLPYLRETYADSIERLLGPGSAVEGRQSPGSR